MADATSRPERYERSRTDRMLAGVCGGLAAYLGVDSTLVRVAWVVVTIFSAGIGLVTYILLWVLAPEERLARPSDLREEASTTGEDPS